QHRRTNSSTSGIVHSSLLTNMPTRPRPHRVDEIGASLRHAAAPVQDHLRLVCHAHVTDMCGHVWTTTVLSCLNHPGFGRDSLLGWGLLTLLTARLFSRMVGVDDAGDN